MEIAFYIFYLKAAGGLERINNQPDKGFSTKTDAIRHLRTILAGLYNNNNDYLILDTYS